MQTTVSTHTLCTLQGVRSLHLLLVPFVSGSRWTSTPVQLFIIDPVASGGVLCRQGNCLSLWGLYTHVCMFRAKRSDAISDCFDRCWYYFDIWTYIVDTVAISGILSVGGGPSVKIPYTIHHIFRLLPSFALRRRVAATRYPYG